MRYQGGKHAVAGRIVDLILEYGADCHSYAEPFVGGGSVLGKIAQQGHFRRLRAGDALPEVAALWEDSLAGRDWPDHISKDEYARLKEGSDDLGLRGFAGFGCSFGAAFFASYHDGAASAKRSHDKLTRPIAEHPDVTVRCASYADWGKNAIPGPGWVVYCDPPYVTKATYGAAGHFDPFHFWHWAAETAARGAVVIVTEDYYPPWATCIDTWDRRQLMSAQNNNQGTYREAAYLVDPETARAYLSLFPHYRPPNEGRGASQT